MTQFNLSTIGELARALGESEHRVSYVIGSRGIKPARRVGVLRMFPTAATLKRLRREFDGIAARRTSPVSA